MCCFDLPVIQTQIISTGRVEAFMSQDFFDVPNRTTPKK
jgi:hypothetical protein